MKDYIKYPLIVILVVSVVCNVVIIAQLTKQEERIKESVEAEYLDKIRVQKSKIETYKKQEQYLLDKQEAVAETEQKEEEPNHLELARAFIEAYYYYDSTNLEERDRIVQEMVADELKGVLTPELENNIDGAEEYNYSSQVKECTIYSADSKEQMLAIAEITYIVKSYEGESELSAYVKLTFEEVEGKILICDYSYMKK